MQGSLLIANPLLNDGFFNRSVIQLVTHEKEGSVGFTLNFRTQLLLKDVKPTIKNGDFPIFEGGPVARNQMFCLHRLGHIIPDSYHVKGDIYFGGDFEKLIEMIESEQVTDKQVKLFSGYSGWGELQLMNEIENGHWFQNNSEDTGFFVTPPEELWRKQLQSIKMSYGIFADFGSDPSSN
jgi:putative transcriptional regulator